MLVLAMQFSKSAERPTPQGRPKERPKVLPENGTEMSDAPDRSRWETEAYDPSRQLDCRVTSDRQRVLRHAARKDRNGEVSDSLERR